MHHPRHDLLAPEHGRQVRIVLRDPDDVSTLQDALHPRRVRLPPRSVARHPRDQRKTRLRAATPDAEELPRLRTLEPLRLLPDWLGQDQLREVRARIHSDATRRLPARARTSSPT